jgi:hypothetical protein
MAYKLYITWKRYYFRKDFSEKSKLLSEGKIVKNRLGKWNST